ncbi:MAG: dethiobiotin synthase [Pirellulales bacterium]|nr:dethiobiotin synthase [Pirellulales bacterium]
MTKGLFITGTDTDVGKTAVAVAILQQCVLQRIDCRAYKPVASGIQSGPTDIDRLWSASGNAGARDDVCPQSFQLPVAPEQAAAAEGTQVNDALLRQGLYPQMSAELVLIEGAGSLFSPLSHQTLNADLARDFQVPLIVVDSSRLGAIGRTLTAVTAAEAVGLTVSAIVLSQKEAGHAGGNKKADSLQAILCQSRAELQRRIPHIVICSLGYNESTIEPFVEWHTIAAQLDMPTKPHP